MGEKREYRRRRRPSDDMDMELRQRQVRRRQTRAPYPEEQQQDHQQDRQDVQKQHGRCLHDAPADSQNLCGGDEIYHACDEDGPEQDCQ